VVVPPVNKRIRSNVILLLSLVVSINYLGQPASASTFDPPSNVELVVNPSIPGDSIQVNWVAPTGVEDVLGYTVRIYGENDDLVNDYVVTNPNATSTIVNNLIKGSKYKAKVVANYRTATAASSESNLQTVIGTPDQLTSPPVAERVDVGTIKLNWTPPGNDGGTPISGFEVYCVPKCSPEDYESTSDTEMVISGLIASTSYKFSIASVNNRGSSDLSDFSNSVFPYAEADAPNILAVTAGDASVTVTWEALTVSGQEITGYQLSVLNASNLIAVQSIQNVSSSATSKTFNSLSNGSSYRVKINAITSVGESPATISSQVTPKAAPVATKTPTKTAPMPIKVKAKKSSKALAKELGIKVPKKSKLKLTVSKSSRSFCKVSNGKLVAKKKGKCVFTLTVQPPKPKKGKKPAAIKRKTSLRIV